MPPAIPFESASVGAYLPQYYPFGAAELAPQSAKPLKAWRIRAGGSRVSTNFGVWDASCNEGW